MENSIKTYRYAQFFEKLGWYALAAVVLFVVSKMAISISIADTGSDIFGDIKKLLEEYIKGTLGVIFALLILLVGVSRSIMTGNMFYLIVAIATCIVLYYAPTVFESLMDSTLTPADVISTQPVITD
ncbi:MAG: hypothetical protein J5934_07015 [Succinivibrio sp.]|nr:hypothetical protein [Succinivibrio sp.]